MLRVIPLIAVCALFSACDRKDDRVDDDARPEPPVDARAVAPADGPPLGRELGQERVAETSPAATVTLQSVKGDAVQGTARLTEEENGVRIVATVTGAAPGKHGIHIHEKPDCSNPVGKSMGAHFSPDAAPHALPSALPDALSNALPNDAAPHASHQAHQDGAVAKRHLGDLGNIDVGPDGNGKLDILVDGASLSADRARSFLDRALIVHAAEDQGKDAQPAGASGDPIACGVIKPGATG